jgi:site-specific DNA recombinase
LVRAGILWVEEAAEGPMTGPVRCAIYTRKSSEEGLEQSFNSLHAQREACEAYILSQRHEGWQALTAQYDDGGFSGGTMERPALKRLITDIAAGKINTVVVYKVDRLTRSLADFAKIIEQFDQRQVSFVSVTQQFNTTSSMGRLTLNVLLSFAQFEREVTGERIRDKIAASKRKGMWMGGHVPFGYDLRDRKLYINRKEVEQVREIYQQYLKLGCVSALKEYLDKCHIRSRIRTIIGKRFGGTSFSRGALYKILRNRLYAGEIAHKGQVYPGDHEPIIERDQWTRVQDMLVENQQGTSRKARATKASLLTGVLFDEHNNRFTPTHTNKTGRRYRYYTSQAIIRKAGDHDLIGRIPAHDLEQAVIKRVLDCLRSPEEILAAKEVLETAGDLKTLVKRAGQKASTWPELSTSEQEMFLKLILHRVVIHRQSIEIRIDAIALVQDLLANPDRATATVNGTAVRRQLRLISLSSPFEVSRHGKALRLVIGDSQSPSQASATAILKAIARSRLWYDQIVAGEVASIPALAKKHGVALSYVNRIFRFASLGPDAIEAIMNNQFSPQLTLDALVNRIPLAWKEQRQIVCFK